MILAAYGDTLFKVLFLGHMLSLRGGVRTGSGQPDPHGEGQGRRRRPRRSAEVVGHLGSNGRQIHFPALVALGGFGIAMVLTSDDVFSFGDTWVSLAFLVWLAIAGLVSGVIMPNERKVARGRPRGREEGGGGGSDHHRPRARDALPDDLEARSLTDADELVRPLSGADWWNVPASGEVAAFRVSDGPSGVRGQRFVGGPPSVSFPCGAALGATWDVDLVARVGAVLAEEARAKGAHVLLGPTVNLQRTPLGGRHFECFSEDPVLTAGLAVAYVEGLQGAGVAACVKHLVANDQEHDRFEVSSEPDERTLREVSLLPFEHALRRAGAWSTMAAYNRLHGTHCSQHERLLTTILRDEWGWDGVVISDWFAVHATVEPALAGLDLEMPGPPLHWGPALAARRGRRPGAGRGDRGEARAAWRSSDAARAPTALRPAMRRPGARRPRWRSLERRRPRRSCCCATRACSRCGRTSVASRWWGRTATGR